MKKVLLVLSITIILSICLSGCNLPGKATPTSQVDEFNTSVARTIEFVQTQSAPTEEPPTQEISPTATLEESGTESTATLTPEVTISPTVTATLTEETDIDKADFVSETIPDGTDFDPGKTFTKVWTLKNSGTTNWNADFDIVFVSGDAMNAPASQPITSGIVAPGQSVQISLELTAPIAAGKHRGNFKLRNADNVLFGIGEAAKQFWVEIEVLGTKYDFTENYCASGVTWTSDAGTLPCPGTVGDSNGWVRKINDPLLENGIVDDEPGLQVHPQTVNDGWVKGTFPEMQVTEGVFFKAIVGCSGTSNCDVNFKLNYKINGGAEQTLATWHEKQDNSYNKVKVDLDSLAGKDVQFILLVNANGSSANDTALWFGPRIEP